MLHLAWLLCVVTATAVALWGVYRGGTTLNDHLIATVVSGCHGVYALLGFGALSTLAGPALAATLAALGLGLAALAPPFVVMASRREPAPGPRWGLMLASQPAYAFAFWAGCLIPPTLLLRVFTGGPPLWPGAWLWPALALAVWGSAWALIGGTRTRRHRLPLAPAGSAPLRLVQISDLHVGNALPGWQLRRVLARVRDLAPDLVLVTGDLVGPYSDAPGEHPDLVPGLAGLGAPVLLCPGNHDMPRWPTLKAELEQGGITVLDDEATTLTVRGTPVWALGLGFRWGEPGAPSAAVVSRAAPPPDALCLLLCHDPRALRHMPPDVSWLGLAGHTHGGPLSLGMFGLPLSILRLTASHDAGLARQGAGWVHVHSGNLVVGVPPRIGTVPEIAVIEVGQAPPPPA